MSTCLYRSIALDEFYNFVFECKEIGRSVQSQIHENEPRESASSARFRNFRPNASPDRDGPNTLSIEPSHSYRTPLIKFRLNQDN